jgi:hypothetical protein
MMGTAAATAAVALGCGAALRCCGSSTPSPSGSEVSSERCGTEPSATAARCCGSGLPTPVSSESGGTERSATDAEALLVLTLRAEVTRQGGQARLATLLTYCPAVRPLLRDRRLLSFFREHPEAFAVDVDVTSTTVLHTKSQEGKIHPNIMHTVRVLEPASVEELRSVATDNQAVQLAARQVLQCVR